MPEYTYQSPVLYPYKFGIDHFLYHWTPNGWTMEGDDFGVRRQSMEVLNLNRIVITPGVRSKVKWVQSGTDDVYVNARKGTVQKWSATWQGDEGFMTRCLRDHLNTLYTTQQGFWLSFDDEMSYTGVQLEPADGSYQYYLTPTYPIAYYRTVDVTGQNLAQTGFFKLYKNGVAMEDVDSNWLVDTDTGLVYFSTPQLSTDVITIDYQWRLYCRVASLKLQADELAQTTYTGVVEFEQLPAPDEVTRFDNIVFQGDPCVNCMGPNVVEAEDDTEVYNDPPPIQDECAGWEIVPLTLSDFSFVNGSNWIKVGDTWTFQTGNSGTNLLKLHAPFSIPSDHVVVGMIAKTFLIEENRSNAQLQAAILGLDRGGHLAGVGDPAYFTKNGETTDLVDSANSAIDIVGFPGDTTYGDTDKQWNEDVLTHLTSDLNSDGIDIGVQMTPQISSAKFGFSLVLDSDVSGNYDAYNGGSPINVDISGPVTDNYTTFSFTSDVYRVNRTKVIAFAGRSDDVITSTADSSGTIKARCTYLGSGIPPSEMRVRIYGYIYGGIYDPYITNPAFADTVRFADGSMGGLTHTTTVGPQVIGFSSFVQAKRFDFDQEVVLIFDPDTGIAEAPISFDLSSRSDNADPNMYTYMVQHGYSITADFKPWDYLRAIEIDVYHREVCDSGDQFTTTQLTAAGAITPTGNGANGSEIVWVNPSSGSSATLSTQLMGIDYSRLVPDNCHLLGAKLSFEAKATGGIGTQSFMQALSTTSTFPHSGGDSEFNNHTFNLTSTYAPYEYGGMFVMESLSQNLRWSDVDGVFPYFFATMAPSRTISVRNVVVTVYFAQVVVGA